MDFRGGDTKASTVLDDAILIGLPSIGSELMWTAGVERDAREREGVMNDVEGFFVGGKTDGGFNVAALLGELVGVRAQGAEVLLRAWAPAFLLPPCRCRLRREGFRLL